MYCTRCGTKNAKSAKFCRECGRKLHAETPQSALMAEERIDVQPADMVKTGELMFRAFQSYEAGKVVEAERLCKEALQEHPDSSSGHSLLAMIFEAKGDLRGAMRHLERVLVVNPGSIADRGKLQELRARMKSLPRAVSAKRGLIDDLHEDIEDLRRFLVSKRPWPEAIGIAAAAFLLLVILWPHIRPARTATRQSQVPSSRSGGPIVGYTPAQQPAAPPVTPPGRVPQFIGLAPAQEAPTPMYQPSAAPPPRYNIPRAATPAPEPRYGSFPTVTVQPRPRYQPSLAVAAPPAATGTNNSGSMRIERSATAPAPPTQSPTERARQLQLAGEYEAAIGAWQQALAGGRNIGQIHQHIATCYQRIGRHKDAVTSFQTAIKSYQQDISAGRNVEDARRGIKSSELGVTVSQREGG